MSASPKTTARLFQFADQRWIQGGEEISATKAVTQYVEKPMTSQRRRRFDMESVFGNRHGFTLLELLLVLVIISAVAWVSLSSVSTNMEQIRFDDTRNRLQAIRKAIIGDTSRTVNGGPELSGYVADMGGLPPDINALLAREYCRNDPGKTTAAGCGASWVSQPKYEYDATYGLWAGWNGPYLQATGLSGHPRFQDGWGRPQQSNLTVNPQEHLSNFGWIYSHEAEDPKEWDAGWLLVQSYGRDGLADDPNTPNVNAFDDDYPQIDPTPLPAQKLISNNQWRVLVTDSGTASQGDDEVKGGLTVDFGSPAAGDTKYLCMALAKRSLNPATGEVSITEIINSGNAISLVMDGGPKTATFVFEDYVEPAFDEDTWLPLGQAAYGVFEHTEDNSCTGGPAPLQTETATVFPAGVSRWTVFSVVPGTVMQPFKRNMN